MDAWQHELKLISRIENNPNKNTFYVKMWEGKNRLKVFGFFNTAPIHLNARMRRLYAPFHVTLFIWVIECVFFFFLSFFLFCNWSLTNISDLAIVNYISILTIFIYFRVFCYSFTFLIVTFYSLLCWTFFL